MPAAQAVHPTRLQHLQKERRQGEIEDRPAKESKMDAEAPIGEPMRKAIRSDSGSGPPSPSASLFPPKFAGKVSQEDQDYQDDDEGYHEDELWEDSILKEEDWIEEEDEGIEDEEDMPPKVSEEELEERDQVAAKDELNKLRSMQVVKEVRKQECDQSGKFLTLTTVFDWRKRDREWKRRCRIVCREFRAGAASNEETFSPTTGHAAVRMMIALHLIFGWELTSLDIKDAFLQVSQKVLMYAEISPWIKKLLGLDEDCVWKVEKCLPGQRAAAEQWFSHLCAILERLGFEAFKGIPSVLRHKVRPVAVSVHVDDELVAGKKGQSRWLVSELKKVFKLTIEGPFPSERGSREQLHYLKRTYEFVDEGILVSVSKKRYEKLRSLYDLGNRKEKMTPEHQLLGSRDETKETKELAPEEAKRFRSALGTLLYVAQDRWDLQHSVKCLASYMAKPTEMAVKCLQQTLLYVRGTESLCFLLRYSGKRATMMEVLYRLPQGEELEAKDKEEGEEEEKRKHVLEVFADADWASGKEARYSTSASIICADGVPVMSYSRTQKSTALSSCESEVLATSGAASEGTLLKKLLAFLTREEVDMEVRSDSSSGRQWCLRSGVGGLKHIDLRVLWLQRGVKRKMFKVKPIPTKLNIADLNTKKMSVQRRKFLLFLLGAMTKERGREVPVGAEEMADHLSSVALNQQIKRLKQVGRTTKNSRLLFTTCLVQMVMGSRGQPREFIRETYVYVEAASMWMFVVTLLMLMVLYLQFVSIYDWRRKPATNVVQEPEQEPDGAQSPSEYGTPTVEENEDEEEEQGEHEAQEEEEQAREEDQVQEDEQLPRRGNDHQVVNNEPEGDPDPGPVPQDVQDRLNEWLHQNVRIPAQQQRQEQPPVPPVHQPQGVRMRVRLEYAVISGRRYHRQGCGSLMAAKRVAEYTMELHQRLNYRPCLVCDPPQLPDP